MAATKEPISNCILICKECGDGKRNNWQKANKDKVIKVGNYVKLAFVQADKVEHMWVKITKVISATRFSGILDNDPIAVSNIRCGDPVEFDRSSIEEWMK